MELIVKINSNPGDISYKDGDVVQAFSNKQIQFSHAEMICNINNYPLDPVTGLRTNNTLLMKFLEKTKAYKFERVNPNDVLKTDLTTGQQTTLNMQANENGEYIDVLSFISRRLKKQNHKIFGSSGNEIWYGGSTSDIDIDFFWNDIETHTNNLKINHSSWPFTDLEKKRFICINTSGRKYTGDSFTRVELSGDTVHERAMPALETRPEETSEGYSPAVLAKRKWFVPYWDLSSQLGASVDDLRNPEIICDCRKPTNEREHIDILTYDKVSEGIL